MKAGVKPSRASAVESVRTIIGNPSIMVMAIFLLETIFEVGAAAER